jgi:hypothetical protein
MQHAPTIHPVLTHTHAISCTALVSYVFLCFFCYITYAGSLFQLLEGNPPVGVAGTAAIVVIGFPVCGFLFYASIKKATAETELDDKEFLSTRRK